MILSVLKTKSVAVVGAIAGAFTAVPALGAERIQFFYGPFEPTIYVEDLETFAETGEVAGRFSFFASRLNSEQKSSLRDFLNSRYDLDVVSTARFTYSPIGERMLRNAGQIIQTESFLNGMKPLRAGFIFAAANSQANNDNATAAGYSPLDIIREFPLETIQINAELAREVIAENEAIFTRRDRIIANIRQLAKAQADLTSQNLPDSAPEQQGPYGWEIETIQFQNPARPAESPADIYYPVGLNSSSVPVVIISHGFASNRKTFAYLAEHLASHGYAVVAVEHIESDSKKIAQFLDGLEGAPDPYNFLQRPQDITTVLDWLENYSGENPLLKKLNLESVGLMGQSLGGYTVLASAGAAINLPKVAEYCAASLQERLRINLSTLLQCRIAELPEDASLAVADDRVAAVIAINPLTSQVFGESGLQQIQVPVMMIAGTRDYFVPAIPEQVNPFSWLTTEHKKLVVIDPGTHFSALDVNERTVLPIPQGLIGADPRQSFPAIQGLGLSFFNYHLLGRTEAALFLSQTYLDQLPEGDFQFSLIDEYSVQ